MIESEPSVSNDQTPTNHNPMRQRTIIMLRGKSTLDKSYFARRKMDCVVSAKVGMPNLRTSNCAMSLRS